MSDVSDICYFCKQPLPPSQHNAAHKSARCPLCSTSTGINVFTTETFSHIYVTISDRRYYIRLYLKENATSVTQCVPKGKEPEITRVTGFPFTPQNAINKLRTILTFL